MTTRIWYENDALNVSGVGALPPRTLTATVAGDRIVVQTLAGDTIAQLAFGEYAKKDGTGFATVALAKAYLDGEFAKRPLTLTLLGTAILTETATVAISAGVRRLSITLSGAAVGDVLVVVLTGAPTAGCEAHGAYVTAANKVSVGCSVPLIALGGSYSIPIAIYRLN